MYHLGKAVLRGQNISYSNHKKKKEQQEERSFGKKISDFKSPGPDRFPAEI